LTKSPDYFIKIEGVMKCQRIKNIPVGFIQKRQLGRAVEHVEAIALVLTEVGERYHEAKPIVSAACKEMHSMTSMLQSLLECLRGEI